jgi:hypothetical protein
LQSNRDVRSTVLRRSHTLFDGNRPLHPHPIECSFGVLGWDDGGVCAVEKNPYSAATAIGDPQSRNTVMLWAASELVRLLFFFFFQSIYFGATMSSNRTYIATVIASYWVVSISMVYLNKILLSSPDASIPAPLFVTW